MKFESLLIGLVLMAGITAQSQTVITTTNASGGTTSITNPSSWTLLQLAGGNLLSIAETMKPFTTNGEYLLQVGVGKNTADKNWIEVVQLTVPVSTNVAIGVVGYHKGSKFYEGGGDLQWGLVKSFPVIGNVRLFVGDGIVYNFKTRSPANYALTGGDKDWDICQWLHFGVGIAIANTSDTPGADYIGGGHFDIFPWRI
jgi:hypothetical protein